MISELELANPTSGIQSYLLYYKAIVQLNDLDGLLIHLFFVTLPTGTFFCIKK